MPLHLPTAPTPAKPWGPVPPVVETGARWEAAAAVESRRRQLSVEEGDVSGDGGGAVPQHCSSTIDLSVFYSCICLSCDTGGVHFIESLCKTLVFLHHGDTAIYLFICMQMYFAMADIYHTFQDRIRVDYF